MVDAEPLARGLVLAIRALRRAGEPTPREVSDLFRTLTEVIPKEHMFPPNLSPGVPMFRGESLSAAEVGARLGTSQQAVRGLARRGRLVARRGAGGHWEISDESVTKYLEGRRGHDEVA